MHRPSECLEPHRRQLRPKLIKHLLELLFNKLERLPLQEFSGPNDNDGSAQFKYSIDSLTNIKLE
jgi:hypothetical protein